MSRLPLLFIVSAALCLVVGVTLGLAMGIAHDFHLAPVHAHLNLLGWTSLALMGLTYRAWPELAERRAPALTQYALSAGAAFFCTRLVLSWGTCRVLGFSRLGGEP